MDSGAEPRRPGGAVAKPSARENDQPMQGSVKGYNRGFSLIELVIVVVIIGIIGAIAVPRMSRGARGASDSALTANLTVLRNALDLYAAEHGGAFPDFVNMPELLLQYSDFSGTSTSSTKDGTHLYGPYLRAMPKLPVGANKGLDSFTNTAPGATAQAAGWYYNESTGEVRANCADSETDEAGVKYNSY